MSTKTKADNHLNTSNTNTSPEPLPKHFHLLATLCKKVFEDTEQKEGNPSYQYFLFFPQHSSLSKAYLDRLLRLIQSCACKCF